MLGRNELILVQPPSAGPQPRHERFTQKGCALQGPDLSERAGRGDDPIASAGDEIAGGDGQALVSANGNA